MTNPNAKLYDLLMNEKNRHADVDMTFLYRKSKDNQDASMRYISKQPGAEGVLTVLFRKNGDEDFYFKQENEKGIGVLVQHLTDGGQYAELENAFNNMPSLFRNITQDYQYNRDELGIEEKQPAKTDKDSKPKPKSKFERD